MGFILAWPDVTGKPLQVARRFLQRAIELEHATIPPYLTALYSLVPGRNDAIGAVIRSVVTEEMAHMVLAANILSAINGHPRFTSQRFLPKYPGGLPYHIGGSGFKVPLAPFSIHLVKNVFMVMEQPEGPPLEFPIPPPVIPAALSAAASAPRFSTVGEFYIAIKELLVRAGKDVFRGDPDVQLSIPHGAFIVTSLDDAIRAIDAIVRQGEGSPVSPLGGAAGELAHYYRFAEIVKGRALVGDPNQPPYYYSYSGLPIPFDPTGVIPIVTNANSSMYRTGSQADRVSREFNGLYGNVLRLLELAYQGTKEFEANITGLMFDMKIMAQRLMSIQVDPPTPYGPTTFAAPTFEYSQLYAAL